MPQIAPGKSQPDLACPRTTGTRAGFGRVLLRLGRLKVRAQMLAFDAADAARLHHGFQMAGVGLLVTRFEGWLLRGCGSLRDGGSSLRRGRRGHAAA